MVMREFFPMVCGYGNNLVVVYGHVKNFGCGKIWWGIDFLLWDIDIFRRMGILMGILLDM